MKKHNQPIETISIDIGLPKSIVTCDNKQNCHTTCPYITETKRHDGMYNYECLFGYITATNDNEDKPRHHNCISLEKRIKDPKITVNMTCRSCGNTITIPEKPYNPWVAFKDKMPAIGSNIDIWDSETSSQIHNATYCVGGILWGTPVSTIAIPDNWTHWMFAVVPPINTDS